MIFSASTRKSPFSQVSGRFLSPHATVTLRSVTLRSVTLHTRLPFVGGGDALRSRLRATSFEGDSSVTAASARRDKKLTLSPRSGSDIHVGMRPVTTHGRPSFFSKSRQKRWWPWKSGPACLHRTEVPGRPRHVRDTSVTDVSPLAAALTRLPILRTSLAAHSMSMSEAQQSFRHGVHDMQRPTFPSDDRPDVRVPDRLHHDESRRRRFVAEGSQPDGLADQPAGVA